MEISEKTNDMMMKLFGEDPPGPDPPGPQTDTAILALNTKPFEAKPLLFDLNGMQK